MAIFRFLSIICFVLYFVLGQTLGLKQGHNGLKYLVSYVPGRELPWQYVPLQTESAGC